MNFIMSVFGANVVIFVGGFVYLYIIFVTYKCLFNERYVKWKKYGLWTRSENDWNGAYDDDWKEEEEYLFIGHIITSLCWPLSIVCVILWKIASCDIPFIIKTFDKITPSIKIEKEKE